MLCSQGCTKNLLLPTPAKKKKKKKWNTYGNGWNCLFWVELDPVQAHQADGAQYVRFLCGQMRCRGNPYLYNICSGGIFIHMCTITLLEKKTSVTWALYSLRVKFKLFDYLLNLLIKKALYSHLKQMTIFLCLILAGVESNKLHVLSFHYLNTQFIAVVIF